MEQIEQIEQEIASAAITDKESLEEFRMQYISKKGKIAGLFANFAEMFLKSFLTKTFSSMVRKV